MLQVGGRRELANGATATGSVTCSKVGGGRHGYHPAVTHALPPSFRAHAANVTPDGEAAIFLAGDVNGFHLRNMAWPEAKGKAHEAIEVTVVNPASDPVQTQDANQEGKDP